MAGTVAGGIALALGGDGSSGTGAVGAGGGDLCRGPHFIVSIGWGGGGAEGSKWQVADGARDRGQGWRGLARPELDRKRILCLLLGFGSVIGQLKTPAAHWDWKMTLDSEAR